MRIKPPYAVQMDSEKLDETVERLGDSLMKSVNSIVQSQIIAGEIVANIKLSAVPSRVPHKLGRKPLGWLIVDQDANATIYSSKDIKPELFLTLTSTADVTVSLWVF